MLRMQGGIWFSHVLWLTGQGLGVGGMNLVDVGRVWEGDDEGWVEECFEY